MGIKLENIEGYIKNEYVKFHQGTKGEFVTGSFRTYSHGAKPDTKYMNIPFIAFDNVEKFRALDGKCQVTGELRANEYTLQDGEVKRSIQLIINDVEQLTMGLTAQKETYSDEPF